MLLAAVIVALAGLAPLYMAPYHLRIACGVLLYTMLGSGLTIVVGYAGLLDLGFIAFYAIGAYAYALLASAQFDIHVPFLVVLVIAPMLAAGVGFLLGFPVLRLRGDYLAIVTLGFGEIIRVLINNVDWLTNGPQGVTSIDRPDVFGWQLRTPAEFYYLFLVATVLIVWTVFRLESSMLGKSWRAIREDQDAAAGIGIGVTRAKLLAFALSAAIGGFAGVLFAAFQRYVSPESFALQESILVVLIIIIGGLGNLLGVILGAVLLLVLPEVLRGYEDYRMLIVGSLMVVIILLRPRGLLPREYGIIWLRDWIMK